MLGMQPLKKINKSYSTKITSDKTTSSASTLEAIDPTEKTNTNMANSTPEQLYNFNQLYEDLDELKDAYQKFNHDENELGENLIKLLENPEDFIHQIASLIDAYNHAVLSLYDFDHAFSTHNMDAISSVLQRSQYRLKTMGLFVLQDYQIQFNEHLFIEKVSTDLKSFNFLFNNKNGIFLALFNIFHDIKIPKRTTHQTPINDIHGSIIDKKG